MRRSLLLFWSCALLTAAFAQQPSSANSPRIRHLPFGLQGRVHTVMLKIENLRPDPRTTRRLGGTGSWTSIAPLSTGFFSPSWLSFAENGRILEQGTVSSDGKFSRLVQQQGDTSITTVKVAGKEPEVTETHRIKGQRGTETVESYRNGELTERSLSRTSKPTGDQNHFDFATYDRQGKLLNETSTDTTIQAKGSLYANTRREVFSLPNGTTEERNIVDKRNMEEGTGEHSEYGPNGVLLCTLRLSGTTLVYSSIIPEASRPCYAGAISKNEEKRYEFALYPNVPGGELFTEISTYADMQRLSDPDVIERFDASGNVIDKVALRYERDTQGNWTSRVVSVLDPATKDLVEIERDTRTITYYDQQ